VSRPHSIAKWGTLPGAYVLPAEVGPARAKLIPGSKPLRLMRAIVRDYTRPGDLIVDPFVGSGTTLLAAAIEGRSAIGAECDLKTFALAVRRLSAGWTKDMF
jgi:site-specific DNA-methyltransferase (adenine-specific)